MHVLQAGTTSVSIRSGSTSSSVGASTNPGASTTGPVPMPTMENRYHGETRWDRSPPKISHGTAASKIGMPSDTASTTSCARIPTPMT